MKFVREESRPISGDNGLQDIRRLAEAAEFATPERMGERYAMDIMPSYVEHLLSYVQRDRLKPLRIWCTQAMGAPG